MGTKSEAPVSGRSTRPNIGSWADESSMNQTTGSENLLICLFTMLTTKLSEKAERLMTWPSKDHILVLHFHRTKS